MSVCILCGVFAQENEWEVIKHAKRAVEFSANIFQKKLIDGFCATEKDITIISAPFLGSYPNASNIFYFSGFEQSQDKYEYVKFCNLWGYRNVSRAKSLKKALKDFIEKEDKEKLIVVYCTHTPFLEAAFFAKKKDPNIRVCLYVPDLPEYMNLSASRKKLYDFAKKYDIAVMKKYMGCVDSFVLLTEEMKDMLPVAEKPYLVIEGIISREDLHQGPKSIDEQTKEKYVVYTGKLDEKFGIKTLIDAFDYIDEPDYRLILCGTGDSAEYAARAAQKDSRICPMGQVTPEEAKKWQSIAAVLVNPRPNNEEYTKYSFPSKNIEYLLTGKPVVAYMLDGMPCKYEELIVKVADEKPSEKAIATAIKRALAMTLKEQETNHDKFVQYAKEHLEEEKISQAISVMNTKCMTKK